MATVKIETNTKKLLKKLNRKQGALARVGSETVNDAVDLAEGKYKKNISKMTIRTKFTLGAVRKYKSKPQSSGGKMRKLGTINAKVGVMKMKGGKEHYLKKQEEGRTVPGKLDGSVPVPMDTARIGGSFSRPVSRPLRLGPGKTAQELTIGGIRSAPERFGHNDRFRPDQRWAIFYKYSGLSKKQVGGNPYGWDLKKQFIFSDMEGEKGLFRVKGKRVKKVRTLEKKSVRIKARHDFEKSLSVLSPVRMDSIFVKNANKYLKE